LSHRRPCLGGGHRPASLPEAEDRRDRRSWHARRIAGDGWTAHPALSGPRFRKERQDLGLRHPLTAPQVALKANIALGLCIGYNELLRGGGGFTCISRY